VAQELFHRLVDKIRRLTGKQSALRIRRMLIQAIFANLPTAATTLPQVHQSIGEIGEGVLHSYRPSGSFRTVEMIVALVERDQKINAIVRGTTRQSHAFHDANWISG
jgi:hypothetical protein